MQFSALRLEPKPNCLLSLLMLRNQSVLQFQLLILRHCDFRVRPTFISVIISLILAGGAVICASVHVGEIQPGGMRGNHRHHTCNETFVLWGARTKFRVS